MSHVRTGAGRILVVRGDLRSETGWSRATRALLGEIAADFDEIFGVDLHYHPERSRSHFPYQILNDDFAAKLASDTNARVVVMHICLPETVFRYPNALNVGWWFWETDRLPSNRDWIERLESLDLILVPSRWQAEVVGRLRLRRPIRLLAWPHDVNPRFDSATKLEMARSVRIFRLTDAKPANLGNVLDYYRGYYFAVQTDAPRKGLPVLISEWRRYRTSASNHKALVIRFSSLDVNVRGPELLKRCSAIATAACRGQFDGLNHIFIAPDTLPEENLQGLYAGADAFISPTFGEGFGGTIVEAVQNGCLVVAPRHTACGQLIPQDYPFSFETIKYLGSLIGQLPIQPPNGSWHVPRPGSIADCLHRIEVLSPSGKHQAKVAHRMHLRDALSPIDMVAAFRASVEEALLVSSKPSVDKKSHIADLRATGR